jgi:tetratricopeptide (TPR) repeat protein
MAQPVIAAPLSVAPPAYGHALLIEAPRGRLRREVLAAQVEFARRSGAEAYSISCRLDLGGPWAGLSDLLRALIPHIDATYPELLWQHRYELALALPELRQRFPLKDASLTDATPIKERVRSYPTDRAYRLLHGLIDLLATHLSRPDAVPLVVVCDDFDAASHLVRRFFGELMRRRLARLQLALVFVADAGAGDACAQVLGAAVERRQIELPPEQEAVDLEVLAREADEIEARVEARLGGCDDLLPRLIQRCLATGQVLRAQRWRAVALALYNHFGFYEDALFFGEPLLADLDHVCAQERSFGRWNVISGLFNAYAALNRAEDALQLVRQHALEQISDPKDLVSIYYALAMLYCRFLPQKDLRLAEQYLQKSMDALALADFPESEAHYLAVFNLNGLAFIRHLQGRPEEAIELCRAGFERLQQHLRDDEYRLHRSVLLYNIAQVQLSLRRYEDAVRGYTAAIESDPRYSEYYNERAGIFLRMGRYEEALADLHRAVELSAPYHEVWTNLGQTYKLMQRHDDAVAAYSTALDIDPRQVLPWLGRAQAHEAAGRAVEALADYSCALSLDPQNAQAWSNRAALHFDAGRPHDACSDLDTALVLAPQTAELYWNRGFIRQQLGRVAEAAADFAEYVHLRPDAPDRAEAEARLAALQAARDSS